MANQKILIYLGLNYGESLMTIYSQYDKCIGFEANPNLIGLLRDKFKNCPNVEIINGAVCDSNQNQILNICVNVGHENHEKNQTSSLGYPSDYSKIHQDGNNITLVDKIEVPGIYLPDFLVDRGITEIDTYISDIQGMDFTVLTTLKDFIDQKRILNIQTEASCDYMEGELYDGIPSNNEKLFYNLLSEKYELVGKSNGKYDENDKSRWINRDLFFKVKI